MTLFVFSINTKIENKVEKTIKQIQLNPAIEIEAKTI